MATELCPWLGLTDDQEIRHAEPSEAHVCYAQKRPAQITLDHQSSFCLAPAHRTCTFYREPPAPKLPAVPKAEADEVGLPRRRFRWWLLALWLVVLALTAGAVYFALPWLKLPVLGPTAEAPSATAVPLRVVTQEPSMASPQPTQPPTVEITLLEPTATSTPYPGGSIFSFAPESRAVGWVAGDENTGSHLGDSYLYTGVFDGIIYHGIMQFDLSAVPPGANIHSGTLELTGLDGLRVSDVGAWEVRILVPEADQDWSTTTFQAVHGAAVGWTLSPALSTADLVVGQTNAFELPLGALRDVERRLLDGHVTLSIRIDGPLAGKNNVFAWDAGYGPATRGSAPRLTLSVGPAPKTPPPTVTPRVMVVTSTPTPGNVLTAAVMMQTATALASATGQATPGLVVLWTATPTVVVTSRPTAANEATAEYENALATAIALTTGTFTPTPLNVVTATPTPETPTPTGTPSGTPPAGTSTATPLPPAGTPTATPTATPLPPVTPTPEPTIDLAGRILFRSDRQSASNPWAMNPDGTGVIQLADSVAYTEANSLESRSPDRRQRVYVGVVDGMSAILVAPVRGGAGEPLVAFQDAQLSSPVWAPAGGRIAFVSSSAGGAQIWLIYANGTGVRQLSSEAWGVLSHPTFSPDGRSLAYASASISGKRQIWLVGVDGSGRRNLSSNDHDEWDPVWVK